jgi:hypothetical protein
VGQLHELQTEDPVRSRWCPGPFALVLGLVGAFLTVVALSALFAHPAGASTPPGSSVSGGAPVIGAVPGTAQAPIALLAPVVTPESATPASSPTTVSNPAPHPVATLLHGAPSALQGLAPTVQPITTTIASPLGQIVTTATSLPTSVTGIVPPVAPPAAPLSGGAGTHATTTHSFLETDGPAGSSSAFGVHLGSPGPLPTPARPFQGFPLVTTSSPAADGSSSSGGSALTAAPVSGPLLPDPLVSGVIPEQSGVPRFLFDMRSSPPG